MFKSSLHHPCNLSVALKLFYLKVLKTITGLSCLLQPRIEPSASCPESGRRPSQTLLPEMTRQLVKVPHWLWGNWQHGRKGKKMRRIPPSPRVSTGGKIQTGHKEGNPSGAQQCHRGQVWGGQDSRNQQDRGGRRREKQVPSSRSQGPLGPC